MCTYAQCARTHTYTHTSKWGRSEMLWSVGVIQRKQHRQDRLELGCSTTPSYTRGSTGTRTWMYTMCTLTHSRTHFVKWPSWDVRSMERGERRGKNGRFFSHSLGWALRKCMFRKCFHQRSRLICQLLSEFVFPDRMSLQLNQALNSQHAAFWPTIHK